MRSILTLLAVTLLTTSASTPASADVIEMKTGWRFEGQMVDAKHRLKVPIPGKAATRTVVVYRWKLPNGELVNIDPAKVKRIVRGPGPFAELRERKGKLAYTDIPAHYELATWALKQGMLEAGRELLTHVIEIEIDHAGARELLGHEKVDGKWLTEIEAKKARGLKQKRGLWMTPEQMDRDRDLHLRLARSVQGAVRGEVMPAAHAISSKEAKQRARARDALVAIGKRERSGEIVQVAGELYEHYNEVLGYKGGRSWVTTEIRTQHAALVKPIPTRTIGLGGSASAEVRIQTPETQIIQVQTTVPLPGNRR